MLLFRSDGVPTETDLQIESASMFEISNQGLEKWSDAWRRRELARAFNFPGKFDGWEDLADAFQREGNYDLAIKVWEKGVEKHQFASDRGYFETELVRAYDTKVLHDDPIEVYEKAVEDHPSSNILCLRLRNSLKAKGDYQRMVRVFEQLFKNHPTQSKFPLYLAEGYDAIGDGDKAIDVLEKAIQVHVREPALFLALADKSIARNNCDRAIDVLKISERHFYSIESEYSNIRCRIADSSNHMSP